MKHANGAALRAVLAIFALTTAAIAQDVELRSLDGGVTLEGTLRSYDGGYYQLDTVYGPLTVAAEGVSCRGPGCPDLMTFVAEARLSGAATVAESLIPALIEGFAEAQGMTFAAQDLDSSAITYTLSRSDGSPAARFTVTPGTTDAGMLDLLNGDTDIALALRPPTEIERRTARTQDPDDPPLARRVRIVALDALIPVVSQQNPIAPLSLVELSRIFSGEVTNWETLGGPDAPIVPHMLEPGLGLAQDFTTRILLGSDRAATDQIQHHESGRALAEAVARDAYAIGIVPRSARGAARSLALTGPCGFGQSATIDAVKAEDYPLTAPVYLYLGANRLPQLVRQFLAFTETATAERIVQTAGYVNQSLTRTPLALQGERIANAVNAAGDEVSLEDLQEMLARLATAERLSATFRFDGGAVELDAQSQASVARLAAAIERGAFDGRSLIFVGFSDSAGPADVNARLAERRAQSVREAVIAAADAGDADRVTMSVEAFGEAMPMACEDTEWGRAVNRRVEVWLE